MGGLVISGFLPRSSCLWLSLFLFFPISCYFVFSYLFFFFFFFPFPLFFSPSSSCSVLIENRTMGSAVFSLVSRPVSRALLMFQRTQSNPCSVPCKTLVYVDVEYSVGGRLESVLSCLQHACAMRLELYWRCDTAIYFCVYLYIFDKLRFVIHMTIHIYRRWTCVCMYCAVLYSVYHT